MFQHPQRLLNCSVFLLPGQQNIHVRNLCHCFPLCILVLWVWISDTCTLLLVETGAFILSLFCAQNISVVSLIWTSVLNICKLFTVRFGLDSDIAKGVLAPTALGNKLSLTLMAKIVKKLVCMKNTIILYHWKCNQFEILATAWRILDMPRISSSWLRML